MPLPTPKLDYAGDEIYRRGLTLLEIRGARLRLALAENSLAWCQGALSAGYISVDGALTFLDEVLDELRGGDGP